MQPQKSIGETLNFSNWLAPGIDLCRSIVYNGAMNTKPAVLTKDNTKMLAVEASTHKMAKEYAARTGLPLYAAVAQALRVATATENAKKVTTEATA